MSREEELKMEIELPRILKPPSILPPTSGKLKTECDRGGARKKVLRKKGSRKGPSVGQGRPGGIVCIYGPVPQEIQKNPRGGAKSQTVRIQGMGRKVTASKRFPVVLKKTAIKKLG